MTTVRLRPKAKDDLTSIWNYTAETWSVSQADIYVRQIFNAFEKIASGEAVPRKTNIREGYFKLAVGQHVIFYKQNGQAADIIRILHNKIDVELHLR